MKTTLAALVLLWPVALTADDQVIQQWFHAFRGTNYEWVLTARQIEKAPKWNEGEAQAPLPPGKAAQAARQDLAHFFSDAGMWQLESIILKPLGASGDWMYEMLFKTGKPASGNSAVMYAWVLMDGAPVRPAIKGRVRYITWEESVDVTPENQKDLGLDFVITARKFQRTFIVDFVISPESTLNAITNFSVFASHTEFSSPTGVSLPFMGLSRFPRDATNGPGDVEWVRGFRLWVGEYDLPETKVSFSYRDRGYVVHLNSFGRR